MGTWGVSKKELIGKLTDTLDNMEGDFSSRELYAALEFLKGYTPTSDSTKAQERAWARRLNKLDKLD